MVDVLEGDVLVGVDRLRRLADSVNVGWEEFDFDDKVNFFLSLVPAMDRIYGGFRQVGLVEDCWGYGLSFSQAIELLGIVIDA